jgi:hypothetical protein
MVMLDAFKTNGSSPPQRVSAIRYRFPAVSLDDHGEMGA